MSSQTEKILGAIIVVLLFALIYVQFHDSKNKKTASATSPVSIRPNTHPHLDSALYNVILAGLFLEKSIDYGTYAEEKKDALTEIDFVQAFIDKNTGEAQIVDINAKGPNDLRLIDYAVGYARTALNESILIEEDKLTRQQKTMLHNHIQTALDKMLQVQQAEQQSQPQKSNP